MKNYINIRESINDKIRLSLKQTQQQVVDQIKEVVPSFKSFKAKLYPGGAHDYGLVEINGVEFMSKDIRQEKEELKSALVEMDISQDDFIFIYQVFDSQEFKVLLELEHRPKPQYLYFEVST